MQNYFFDTCCGNNRCDDIRMLVDVLYLIGKSILS